jgi:predicted nucleotide-binding protein
MVSNTLTGAWTGQLAGAALHLDLVAQADGIYGRARVIEPGATPCRYVVRGVEAGGAISLDFIPESQETQWPAIHADCRLIDDGQLKGTWTTSVGTSGTFLAVRTRDDAVASGAASGSVFLVHGHDEGTKEKVARFLERLGLDVIILHERVNQGRTLIEKFEEYAGRAAFAVILFTPDDVGFPVRDEAMRQPRARQNVVLELGYFIGRLTRERVCVLHKGGVELPSDIFGIVYHPVDEGDGWKLALAKELKAAGHPVDLNRIVA